MKGPSYPDDTLLIQAAGMGQGLAVLRDVSAFDALASGKIAMATHNSVATEVGYYAIAPTVKARIAKVQRFRDWILSEASETSEMSECLSSANPGCRRFDPRRWLTKKRIMMAQKMLPETLPHAPLNTVKRSVARSS
ncbi:hypothetical protein NKH69_20900 [Mesorhizobium sp. M0976]|uniref:hypothetical protein n=1 Tax=Mesorhizobium sp. M0976 TaxID=2957038 RepID=UPI003336DDF4